MPGEVRLARLLGLASRPRWAAACAGAVALLAYLLSPPGGDVAAHLYQTQVWREHGWRLWDNFWYAGRYSQVNYGVLYYPLAALVGHGVMVVGSVAGAAAAFCQVVRRQWPKLAAWPSLAFCLLAPLGVVAGTYPFLLGLALALAALAAVQAGRALLALAVVALTALAHPLALVFLVAALGGIALSRPGWWRRRREAMLAGGVLAIVVLDVLLIRAFGAEAGHYPFDPRDAGAIALFCAAGLWLTRGLPDQRPLRMLFLAYGAISAAAFVLSSPIGGNVVRLMTLVGAPLLLLPLTARGFRPRVLAVTALASALVWQSLPALAGWRSTTSAKAESEAFWYPVEAFLGRHHDPNFRVEVVATYGHWEALYLARRGVPLARGWYRQDDFPENAILYGPLTVRRYQAWLRRMGVRYVLLPEDDPLDYSARHEANRLRAGAGLDLVARLGGWRVYRLPNATPIVTPQAHARIRSLTADGLTLQVDRPGRYRLRLRYTPYWRVARGDACVAPRRPWGTEVRVRRPGLVRMRFDVRLGTLARAVIGDEGGCVFPRGLRGGGFTPA